MRAKRPHKNQEVLIRALPELPEVVLVLAGHAEPYEQDLRRLAAATGVADRVRFVGYVPDDVLEALWELCACAAIPTLGEGFGLPLVEAMDRGVAIAASDIPVLREVGGDVPHWFDPHNPSAAAHALAAAMADPGCRPARPRPGRAVHVGAGGARDDGRLRAGAEARGVIHVGLNLIFCIPGETGGMEVAARETIGQLAAIDDLRLTAFVNREAAGTFDGVDEVVVAVNATSRVQWVRGEQQLLPGLAARAGCDIVHSLGSTAPLRGPLQARHDRSRPQLQARARVAFRAARAGHARARPRRGAALEPGARRRDLDA